MVGNLHFREAAGLLPALSAQRLAGYLGPQLDPLTAAVSRAGSLKNRGLPEWAIHDLTFMSDGYFHGKWNPIRAFALLTANMGAHEIAQRHLAGDGQGLSPQKAIDELFAGKTFRGKTPQRHFMAKMDHPGDGFEAFRTEKGTEVAFYSKPEELGRPWADFIRDHWADGLGLIVYRNEKENTCGMIFVHTMGKISWCRIPDWPEAWQTSGGTMAFPEERLNFAEALERVVDKGVAMTWKWRAVDESLVTAGYPILTHLGGSKGECIYGQDTWADKERGLRIYAEVIGLLGITLTGSDEGVEPTWADFLAQLAPFNIYGSHKSAYGGRVPTDYTAAGIFRGIQVLYEECFDDGRVPVLIQGYGGIGKPLAERLTRVAGVIELGNDGGKKKLIQARKMGVRVPLFLDHSGGQLSPREAAGFHAWSRWWHRITPRDSLAAIVREARGAQIFSPNAGPHPVTFDVAAALIEGGYRALAGAANNQNAPDPWGSEETIAWILQAAGIFHAADFVINRPGATAVSSGGIGLSDGDMEDQIELVGEGVREDYRLAFKRGIPPYVYRLRKAREAWARILASGRGLGGRAAVSA